LRRPLLHDQGGRRGRRVRQHRCGPDVGAPELPPAGVTAGTTLRVRACRVEELPPGEARRVEGDHQPVAVYNVDGEYFALDDTCTHEKFALTEGWIDDAVVECALHMAKFCIRT